MNAPQLWELLSRLCSGFLAFNFAVAVHSFHSVCFQQQQLIREEALINKLATRAEARRRDLAA